VAPSPSSAAIDTYKPKQVTYRVFGRDPFIPYFRDDTGPYPDANNLTLVGILSDETDRIALLENKTDGDYSYALRERDPVLNGSVWRIEPKKVTFLITEYGISRTHTLRLRTAPAAAVP
jgi:hypothetical protein